MAMLKTKKALKPKNVTLPSTARLRPRDISLLTLSPLSCLLQSPIPPAPPPRLMHTHTHADISRSLQSQVWNSCRQQSSLRKHRRATFSNLHDKIYSRFFSLLWAPPWTAEVPTPHHPGFQFYYCTSKGWRAVALLTKTWLCTFSVVFS